MVWSLRVAVLWLLLVLHLQVSIAGELEDYLTEQLVITQVPGFSCGIVKDGSLVYNFTYGVTDIRTQEPVKPDTIFIQASVSKTITTTALLRALELTLASNGDLEGALDQSIQPLFAVVNPHFPASNVTFRDVLAHVTSFNDVWPSFYRRIEVGDPDPVGDYMRDYFLQDGQYYRRANFHDFPPRTTFDYCNHAFALGGHLVELLTGLELDAFCREHIFAPLGMRDTSFFLRNLDVTRVATCHQTIPLVQAPLPLPHYGIPDYPAGNLRSSVLDLAPFLLAHIQDGRHGETQLLRPETVHALRRVQFPSVADYQGLGFYYRDLLQVGLDRIGHSGGIFGGRTELWHELSTGVGIIMMANGDVGSAASSLAWRAIIDALIVAGRDF